MSMMMISSLNTYTKNMKMQMKWEQKRASGDYSSDENTSLTKQLSAESESSGITKMTGNHSHESVMNGIRAKLNAGKPLSSSELEYLKKYDPETYQHAKTVEMERKAYEQQLKNCKTKEEVQRLKACQMAASLDRVREINNNPNISSGEKLKLTLQEHQKVSSITDSTVKFAESGEYNRLPTEAEKRKAEKDLKEAKEAELKGTDKKETEKAEQDKEESSENSTVKEETDNPNSSESSEKEEIQQIKAAKQILFSSEKNRIEAELTPEAQKVKRAKARAAYTQYALTNEPSVTLDIKK